MKLYEIEGCEECPLKEEELCSGGWSCYGGEPIEPPCVSWDGDMDVDEYIASAYDSRNKQEEYELHLWEEKQKKKQKNEVAKRKRMYLKIYCTEERIAVANIKKEIKHYEKFAKLQNIKAEALNATNEMFGYKERFKVNPDTYNQLAKLNESLSKAEALLKEKQKECRATEKYKSIGRADT